MQKEEEKMKKRVISLLLALVLALGLLPTAAWAAGTDVSALPEFSEGADTSTIQKFKISSADSLEALATAVKENDGKGAYNLKGFTFYLANDIELSDTWTPISNVTYPADAFAGTFDGNGHTISGLNGSNGLFGFVNGATIKNLKVEGTISGTSANVGGIVGKTQGKVTITNCSFTGSVSTSKSGSSNAAGGIVGRVNAGTLKVENCANHATVTAEKASAAGIIGYGGSNKVTITNCYNDGAISGQWYPSGICAQNTKGTSKIQECFNSGSIRKTNDGTYCAGISANFKGEATNCYRTEPSSDSFDSNNNKGISTPLENSDAVKNKLRGIGFLVSGDGKVSLPWEAGGTPAEKNPRIVISGGSTLQMTDSGEKPHTTLTVAYKDMDETPAVTWSASNDCVTLTAPDNASAADNIRIAQANKPGTVTITATVTYNGASYSDSVVITVIPHITYVDIVNPENGVIAPGQTVEAQVSVGGKPYLASYPELKYQWWHYDTSTKKAEKITDATGKSYTIPKTYAYNRIQVEVTCNGVTVSAHDDHKTAEVLSGDDALLAFDKAALTLEKLGVSSTTITEDTKLNLPSEGENGSRITWESSDSSVIDPMTGKVTLPAEGEQKVTLTANLTLNGKKAELPITFVVKSKTAQAVDADKETLEKAAKALSVLHPRFGKDSNVQTMVETRLANAGFSGVGVKFISAEPTNAPAVQAASAISSIGGITYFYDDPNKTVNERTQWFDTYKAHFTLTCGKETKSVEIPVIVYWDADKVKQAMTEQIVSKVTLPETTEKNFDLPKVVDGKKWTLIEWTSSDRAVTISTEKQGTADTLFDPYVGVVTRQTLDQQVELTAKFTFQLADQQIVLYKVFYVTVKGDPNADNRSTLYQNKLDEALTAHLTDAVTGEALDKANVVNDIQFPTTRDLKIDGKYTPVVITSSDPGVIEAPTTPNSARVWVYRPLPGESAKTVTLTVKILDRPNGPQPGDNLSAMRVLASKEIKVTVQPLTQAEIDAEVALMELVKVKVNYWNGIRNANTDQNNVTTDLHAFQECYLDTDGSLTWVYDREDLKNHGIVPVPLDNWYDQQLWRLFRSSNADVITHENLLVSRREESKAITVTSYLSSETLGRYAEKYPQNADFQKLYKQPVTVDLVVTGTQYAQGNNEGRVQAARRALAARPTVTVSFSLSGRGMGFAEDALSYAEGSTVYDVFSDLLVKHGYTCKRRGSYIAAITSNSGVTLEEFDEGKNSGWMYRVNGELVGRYMSAQGLKDGDRIELYFTSDWTSEPGAEGWQKPGKIETIVNADGSVTKIETKSDGTVIETTTWRDGSTLTAETSPNGRVETVEKRADGTTVETVESASGEITASVSVPKSVGSTRVDIPVSKPTGSMVAVIVHPDGTEEIVRGSVVTETGIALRAEGDVRLKIIDNAKRFNDMADHWAKDAVEFASSRELFNGVGNDAFGPDRSMTRGMVSTVLARLAGADTAGGETWYAKGTVWAVENGISDGTNPEQPVTREQLAAMLYRYAGSPAVSGELGFDDADSISAWARDAVRWCVDNGILNGVGGNRMTPQDLARRGQVAAMLMRFLQATV
jgi:hypothetical protein